MISRSSSDGYLEIARSSSEFPESCIEALEALHHVASCPRSLAWILAAARPDTLERAGELLTKILDTRAEIERSERG